MKKPGLTNAELGVLHYLIDASRGGSAWVRDSELAFRLKRYGLGLRGLCRSLVKKKKIETLVQVSGGPLWRSTPGVVIESLPAMPESIGPN